MSPDETLLLWINKGWATPLLDVLFPWVSSRWRFSYPLLVLLLLYALYRYRWDGLKLWLLLLLTVAAGDGLGNLIKHATDQYRPCYEVYDALRTVPGQIVPCRGDATAMPSNHALNFFAGAVFLLLITRFSPAALDFLVFAFLVALSRIYLGKHYPSQVIAGALMGAFIGSISAWLASRWLPFARRIAHPAGKTDAK